MSEHGFGLPQPPRRTTEEGRAPAASSRAGRLFALGLALLIGFVGILFICFFTHWYETVVWKQSEEQQLTANALAPLVLFMVFLLLAVVNPIIHLINRRFKLGRREFVIIVSMWLITAVVSYTSFANPILLNVGAFMSSNIEYGLMKQVGYKSYLPADLYLNAASAKTFFYGLGDGQRHIPISQVPWREWVRPLMFWVPFMLVAVVLSSTLVQMVHRQWSKRELLGYPIADVTNLFISQKRERAFPDVFYSRPFWAGFAIVAFIYGLNYLQRLFPLLPTVRLQFSYPELVREFPFLAKYCCEYTWSLFSFLIHPYMVALVVLVPLDVSLTCWLGWILMILFTGVNFLLTGDPFTEHGGTDVRAGTYVGVFLVILVVGWREYVKIAWLALTFRKTDDPDLRNAVWACRVFVLAFAGLVWLLVHAGLDWLMAVLFGCSFVLITVVIARITAEIGFPWLYNMYSAARVLPISALGPAAIGPKSLVVMSLVGGMLDLFPSTSIAANETTYRKLEETQKSGLPRWRFNLVLLLAAIVAIGGTIFSQLWNDYSFGARRENYMRWQPIRDCALSASEQINRLQVEGKAEKLDRLSGFAKLSEVKSAPGFWRYFAYGFIAVSVFAFMRLRFSWWPLHPLPLLFFNTYVMTCFFFSIFLGWVIKVAMVKIGGGRFFADAKPFFVGVIVGQIVVSMVFVFIVAVYYLIRGFLPTGANVAWC